jgi:2-polyprenyl-3-methyl-5-hydroxy-6-metoxy-1,4-benzoquinol methylase
MLAYYRGKKILYLHTIMKQYLPQQDALGLAINKACNELFIKIQTLDIDVLPFEPFYKWYFKKCHFDRPHFSLKTSAKLLYDAITITGKPAQDVVMMDYGAGLGTLYILAKMIGVKKIIYNDLMQEFVTPAIAVDKAIGIVMDEYIWGDTEETCKTLLAKNIECDVIVSRNVVEHIYDLKAFFNIIYCYQPKAILYNSTTANWNNPAAHLQHVMIHKKSAKIMVQKKLAIVQEKIPNITIENANALTKILLQYGGTEFNDAIQNYKTTKQLPTAKNDYTNVCDETGNWGEHLLPYKKYKNMAPQYNISFKPGFWDVDYKSAVKNLLGKTMNAITKILGKAGVVNASFIYVIAVPKEVRS